MWLVAPLLDSKAPRGRCTPGVWGALCKCGLYLVLPSALPPASRCPHGPVLFLPSLFHVLSLGHIFPLPAGFPYLPCPGSAGPSSGNAHCHPSLILSQLSCGCKSALIIHHLVLALSREQREPGQQILAGGGSGNQALHHFQGWRGTHMTPGSRSLCQA